MARPTMDTSLAEVAKHMLSETRLLVRLQARRARLVKELNAIVTRIRVCRSNLAALAQAGAAGDEWHTVSAPADGEVL